MSYIVITLSLIYFTSDIDYCTYTNEVMVDSIRGSVHSQQRYIDIDIVYILNIDNDKQQWVE